MLNQRRSTDNTANSNSTRVIEAIIYTLCIISIIVVCALCYAAIKENALGRISIDTTRWSADNFAAFAGKTIVILTAWSGVILFIINKIYDFKDTARARQLAEQAKSTADAAKSITMVNSDAINNHALQINGRMTARVIAGSTAAVLAALQAYQTNPNDHEAIATAARNAAYQAAKELENENPIATVSNNMPAASDSSMAGHPPTDPSGSSEVTPFPVK